MEASSEIRIVMKLRVLAAIAIGLTASLVPSAPLGAEPSAQSECTPAIPQSRGSTGALVAADNRFGFALFDRIFGGSNRGNVFTSPVSAALALQMAYDGARGQTRQVMTSTLGLGGMSQNAVRQEAAAVLAALRSTDPHVQLDIANSLWARAGVQFRRQYLQHVAQSYAARIATLDFKSPSAKNEINGWVTCATHGKITSIVDRIPTYMVMYLINAVYFHGDWKDPFNPKLTRPQTFTTGDGRQEQAPLMVQQRAIPYYAGPDFQFAALPYGNGRFSMDVVLPKTGLSLAQLAPRLTASSWQRWTAALRSTEINLALPRLTLEHAFNLNRPLIALGMGQAFSRQADLSGICAVDRCQISDVRQKTYLNVDEKGTTAAGSTSVGIGATSVRITPSMVVNHPFYLAIRDSKSGAILFLGAVNDPLTRS